LSACSLGIDRFPPVLEFDTLALNLMCPRVGTRCIVPTDTAGRPSKRFA
jgi:hypothetical protein